MTDPRDLRIRDARDDERSVIRELTLASYAPYSAVMAPTAWQGLVAAVRAALDTTEPAERIVAEQGGRIVGSVMLFPPGENYGGAAAGAQWPELRLLAVAPEVQGQGVGRALVEECVRRARRTGAAALGLHTSKSMRTAIRMYERMGFGRAPEHDFQPEGAELVTAYRLPLQQSAER
jgi:GNAT superfamily N-acetyltransferase